MSMKRTNYPMKRSAMFRCQRCGRLCRKNINIKRQRYCVECIRPRGHQFRTWSTGREE